jgi:hypothetical protein
MYLKFNNKIRFTIRKKGFELQFDNHVSPIDIMSLQLLNFFGNFL